VFSGLSSIADIQPQQFQMSLCSLRQLFANAAIAASRIGS
jgi:hypothetical protein